jgi:hypothetical protein
VSVALLLRDSAHRRIITDPSNRRGTALWSTGIFVLSCVFNIYIVEREHRFQWFQGVQTHSWPPACLGGHFTVPYEQNTQQSPAFGFNSTPHPVHS